MFITTGFRHDRHRDGRTTLLRFGLIHRHSLSLMKGVSSQRRECLVGGDQLRAE